MADVVWAACELREHPGVPLSPSLALGTRQRVDTVGHGCGGGVGPTGEEVNGLLVGGVGFGCDDAQAQSGLAGRGLSNGLRPAAARSAATTSVAARSQSTKKSGRSG
ncbi:hypothetical protein MAUB1S_01557 [Mycolicibacterium aubagnense]